ncbi:MAG: alkaline phosphatase [Muribaculaceae bacterium]|nr:alkaline phosphatase [Muribaculaceae bacterium]MBO5187535.1 alkaline phosphatase [Prevotella sp.]
MIKHILTLSIAATIAITPAMAAPEAAPKKIRAIMPEPKYIFYFIGDGMGMGPVMGALDYLRLTHNNSEQLTMSTFPVGSILTTYSASTPITDSAAAGTALSTGSKTRNGMLGMNADTIPVNSIARQLKDSGWGVGIVTSVAPDDATPGAFYAHVPNRSMYYEIGRQAATSGYDFIAGADFRGYKDKNGKDTDLLQVIADNEVRILRGRDGADSVSIVSDKKIILLGPDGCYPWNIGYTIDSIPDNLTLPLMTEACLKHLERNTPERFFMMVEGGNIDHALHGNDGPASIKEIINFDEAIKVAYNFYRAHPQETLIIVTADHDTGGMSVGAGRHGYKANFPLVDYQRISKEEFSEYCKSLLKSRRTYTWEDMKEYLTDRLGLFTHIPVTEQQEQTLKDKFDQTFIQLQSSDQKTLYASFNAFAVDVFNLVNNAISLGFTTTSHTGNPVPLFAIGAGSQRFNGLHDNTDIAPILRELTIQHP